MTETATATVTKTMANPASSMPDQQSLPFVPSIPISLVNPVWKPIKIKPKHAYNQINQARRTVCPQSPFWHQDFDLDQHANEVRAANVRKAVHRSIQLAQEASWRTYWSSIGMPVSSSSPSSIRPAFDSRDMLTSSAARSAVLHQHTVFTSPFLRAAAGMTQAEWPTHEELLFEGSARIATEKVHARFLPLPREPFSSSVHFSPSLTTASQPAEWQHRAMITPDPFDLRQGDRVLLEEEIWFKFWFVGDVEFTDPETEAIDDDGVHGLGAALIALLDPRDQY